MTQRRRWLLFSLPLAAACVQPYTAGDAAGMGGAQPPPASTPSSSSNGSPAAQADRQIEALREELRGESEALKADVQALNARMDEIQRQVDQLLKPSAPEGAVAPPSAGSLSELQERLNDLTGKYNAVIYVLRDKGILAADPERPRSSPAAAEAPNGALGEQAWYDQAYDLYKNGKTAEALAQFTGLIKTYPDSALADNAQYWLAECRYAQGEYEAAVAEFAKLIKDYPRSNKVCRATLKIGYAFAEQGKKAEARTALDKVISACGDSEETRLAKKKREGLGR